MQKNSNICFIRNSLNFTWTYSDLFLRFIYFYPDEARHIHICRFFLSYFCLTELTIFFNKLQSDILLQFLIDFPNIYLLVKANVPSYIHMLLGIVFFSVAFSEIILFTPVDFSISLSSIRRLTSVRAQIFEPCCNAAETRHQVLRQGDVPSS